MPSLVPIVHTRSTFSDTLPVFPKSPWMESMGRYTLRVWTQKITTALHSRLISSHAVEGKIYLNVNSNRSRVFIIEPLNIREWKPWYAQVLDIITELFIHRIKAGSYFMQMQSELRVANNLGRCFPQLWCMEICFALAICMKNGPSLMRLQGLFQSTCMDNYLFFHMPFNLHLVEMKETKKKKKWEKKKKHKSCQTFFSMPSYLHKHKEGWNCHRETML